MYNLLIACGRHFEIQTIFQINLKQSPLVLLARTCSSIGVTTEKEKLNFNIHYRVSRKQEPAVKEKSPEAELVKSTSHDRSVTKRPASVSVDPLDLATKKRCVTKESPKRDETNRSVKRNRPFEKVVPHEEDILKSSSLSLSQEKTHVCNWLVNNSAPCGETFQTSELLFSHLRTHAVVTSPQPLASQLVAPHFAPGNHLHGNYHLEMLSQAYNYLQRQQAAYLQSSLRGFPFYKPAAQQQVPSVYGSSAPFGGFYQQRSHQNPQLGFYGDKLQKYLLN